MRVIGSSLVESQHGCRGNTLSPDRHDGQGGFGGAAVHPAAVDCQTFQSEWSYAAEILKLNFRVELSERAAYATSAPSTVDSTIMRLSELAVINNSMLGLMVGFL